MWAWVWITLCTVLALLGLRSRKVSHFFVKRSFDIFQCERIERIEIRERWQTQNYFKLRKSKNSSEDQVWVLALGAQELWKLNFGISKCGFSVSFRETLKSFKRKIYQENSFCSIDSMQGCLPASIQEPHNLFWILDFILWTDNFKGSTHSLLPESGQKPIMANLSVKIWKGLLNQTLESTSFFRQVPPGNKTRRGNLKLKA